jgi:hypothetical protein
MSKPAEPICCTPKRLPDHLLEDAAATSIAFNPVNEPPAIVRAISETPGHPDVPFHAIMTTKYWGPHGAHLTVGFMDYPSSALKKRILSYLNLWGKHADIEFVESRVSPKIRIARFPGQGHYSYLGPDCLHVPLNEQTMNFDGFTLSTPDSEFLRVVPHEGGHALGLMHEHARKELIDLIDYYKAITYFGQTQGWTAQETIAQVLTPPRKSDILASTPPDTTSIMCYQLPGSIMKNGKPFIGGTDINKSDYALMGRIYPLVTMADRGIWYDNATPIFC